MRRKWKKKGVRRLSKKGAFVLFIKNNQKCYTGTEGNSVFCGPETTVVTQGEAEGDNGCQGAPKHTVLGTCQYISVLLYTKCQTTKYLEQNINFRGAREGRPLREKDLLGKNKTIIARCHELRGKHHDLRTATRGLFDQSKS